MAKEEETRFSRVFSLGELRVSREFLAWLMSLPKPAIQRGTRYTRVFDIPIP